MAQFETFYINYLITINKLIKMKKIGEFLQNIEGKNGGLTPLGEKIIKMIAVGLVILVLLFVLLIVSSIGMFNWLELKIRVMTGFDDFLAKGLSFLILAIFFGTPLGGFIWSFIPVPQKNKKIKRCIFLSFFAVAFFSSYFTSKNVYFNPENGKPLKYFSIGVNGEYNFSNSDGYDPITGDKLQQVDRATIIQYLKGSESSGNTNVVEAGENALIGLEKNSIFYPVEFKNETEKNLYLCITFKDSVNGGVIIQRIASKQTIRLNLMEGKHYFGYIDNNGTSYGGRSDKFFSKQTILTLSPYFFDVLIDKQLYNLPKTFCLDVLVSNDQKVTLEEKRVLHNKEMDSNQELWLMVFVGVPIFCVLVFLWFRFGEKLGK